MTGESGETLCNILRRPFPTRPEPWGVVRRILARKHEFGISRVASITALDRVGIPVMQVIRPKSRSVAVSQGKGITNAQAAISGLMEALEGWASERIASDRTWQADISDLNEDGLWDHLLPETSLLGNCGRLSWIGGWDLLSERPQAVPLGLTDTNYIIPSEYPIWLARDTTGLAAGTSLQQAIAHALFEILERHSRCLAMQTPHFFDRFQVDAGTVRTGVAGDIMRSLTIKQFAVGVWAIPSDHALPVYWCHIMEDFRQAPLAPLPASGFGCDRTDDNALVKALLEACQSRLGVISAAREDVTGKFYAPIDFGALTAWRKRLTGTGSPYSAPGAGQQLGPENDLTLILNAARRAGAKAVIAVHLFSDHAIPLHVVRVVAPPLLSNPEVYNER